MSGTAWVIVLPGGLIYFGILMTWANRRCQAKLSGLDRASASKEARGEDRYPKLWRDVESGQDHRCRSFVRVGRRHRWTDHSRCGQIADWLDRLCD
jgi:hypothetical protein